MQLLCPPLRSRFSAHLTPSISQPSLTSSRNMWTSQLLMKASAFGVALLSTTASAAPAPTRRSATQLSNAQIASFRPFTHMAGLGYCSPSSVLALACGGEHPRLPDCAMGSPNSLIPSSIPAPLIRALCNRTHRAGRRRSPLQLRRVEDVQLESGTITHVHSANGSAAL